MVPSGGGMGAGSTDPGTFYLVCLLAGDSALSGAVERAGAVLYTPPTAKPGLAVYRGAGEVGRALLLP